MAGQTLIRIPWPVLVAVVAADVEFGMWAGAQALEHAPGWAEAVLGPPWGERIEGWLEPGHGRQRLDEGIAWIRGR